MAVSAVERAVLAERAHWGMLGLAWLIYFAFGLVSASLFPLVTPIREDLNLSYAQFGLILGAWQLVYIGAALPVGIIIDRIGTKRSLLLGALIVAGSGLARSFADGFATLFAAVAIFGIGGPVISIGLPKLIAEWFTGSRRGMASGIYATGNAIGAVVALAATNSLVLPLAGSWRTVLQTYSTLTLIVALVWLVLGRNAGPTEPRHTEVAFGTREVIRHTAVIPIVVIGFASFLSAHGLRSWLPQILESKGYSPADAGLLASVAIATGIAGSVVVLRLSTVISRRLMTSLLLIAIGLSAISLMFELTWMMLAGIAIYGFCSGAFMPLLLNMLMEIPAVGARYMGAAAGLFFAVGEVGGFAGPALIGVTTDATGSFTAGLLMLAGTMAVMLIPALRLRD